MSKTATAVVAVEVQTSGRPQDWDKAVSVAYFRALNATQKVAARAAGCGLRTVQLWEASDWWPQAQQEAIQRWRTNLSAESRRSLLRAVQKDGDLALKALERLDPAMSAKELTLGRVQEMLGETIRAIREELDEAAAERVLARIRPIWR